MSVKHASFRTGRLLPLPVADPQQSPVEDAKEYIRRGQRRIAVELLEPWVEDFPEDAEAWSVLAGGYYELEDFKKARRAAAKAVEHDPDSARNWCNYGMILRKTGDLYEAERAQHKALTIKSDYRRARTELRKLHEVRTGQRERHTGRFLDL